MTFKVNQRVICVDNAGHPKIGERPLSHWLSVGAVYTIRRVSNRSRALVWIAGINRSSSEWQDSGFFASRFRPINKRRTETSFTIGADPSTDQFDNRRKVRKKVVT